MGRIVLFLITVVFCLTGPIEVRADTTQKDIQVMARMLSFLSSKPTGTATLAIVYAPSIAESRQDAESLRSLLGSGLKVGNLTLVPLLVSVDQLQGMDGAIAILVTPGLGKSFDQIYQAAQAHKLPSISTDFACAQQGKCVVAIRSEPRVDIIVNKAAADQCSVVFAAAVRMMITEI